MRASINVGSFVLINELTSNSGRACTDLNRLSPILILGSESLKILDAREIAVDLRTDPPPLLVKIDPSPDAQGGKGGSPRGGNYVWIRCHGRD